MVNPGHLAKGSVWNLSHFSVVAEARFHGILSEPGGLSETDQESTWLQSSLKDGVAQKY